MRQELLEAVRDRAHWMEQFTRQLYPNAFKGYMERFGSSYIDAVRETRDEKDMTALAAGLIDSLSAEWKKEKLWKRTRAKLDDQQMIVCYLTPMLMELPDSRCALFAEVLQREWASRWPKDSYRIGNYQRIQKGFRNEILGFPLREEKSGEGGNKE